MLAEIESAIVARIKEKAPQIPHVDSIKTGIAQVAKMAFTALINKGEAEDVAQDTKQHVDIVVLMVFKNLKSDEDRRKGAFPVLEAIGQLLARQKLGLGITRIRYQGFTDVTVADERQAGNTVYQLDFKTSYTIETLDEEDAQDLLAVGINYLLNGSDTAAAQDVLTLQTGG